MSIDAYPLTAINSLFDAKSLANSKVAKDTSLASNSSSNKKSFNELLLELEPVGPNAGLGAAGASQPDVKTYVQVENLQSDNVTTLCPQQEHIPTTIALQFQPQVDADATTSVNLQKTFLTPDGMGLPKSQIGYVHNEARDVGESEVLDPLVVDVLERTEIGEVGLTSGGARRIHVQMPFATGLSDSSQTSDKNLVGRTGAPADNLEPSMASLLNTTKNRETHLGGVRIVSVNSFASVVVDLQGKGPKQAAGALTAELQDTLHTNYADNSSTTDKALVARINFSHSERKRTDDGLFNFDLVHSVGARAGVEFASDGGGSFPDFLRGKADFKSSTVELGGGAVSQGWDLRQSAANVDAPLSEGVVGTANVEQTEGAYWVSGDMRNIDMTLDGVGEVPVEVSISLHGKQTHVSFRTDEVQTRAALESTGSTLKDMLYREGLELTGVSVGFATSSPGGGANGGQESRQQDDLQSFKMESRRPSLDGEPSPSRAQQRSGSLDVFV